MSKKILKYLLICISMFALLYIPSVNAGPKVNIDCEGDIACQQAKDEAEAKAQEAYQKGLQKLREQIKLVDDENVFNCTNKNVYKAFDTVGRAFAIVKIVVPVIIAIVGIVSFGKAVIAQDDTDIKNAFNNLLKKIILGAMIYLIPTIVIAFMKYAVNSYSSVDNNWVKCINLLK